MALCLHFKPFRLFHLCRDINENPYEDLRDTFAVPGKITGRTVPLVFLGLCLCFFFVDPEGQNVMTSGAFVNELNVAVASFI